uniref:Sperm microtubule inner protein 1 C-terminal domain-containing protein n=1 Tax=Timema cristinae TaxID=61476 RepID=A0A7R9CZ25_TIMCR|nr:unnamed protein product [Timema cristinae]
MARPDAKFTGGYDITQQNMLNERVHREEVVRRVWFDKYFQDIYENWSKSKISSKTEALVKELSKGRTARYQAEERHAIKKHKDIQIPELENTDFGNVMRPFSKDTKNILYGDVTNDGGRDMYLKVRADIPPDERYYFPETTSFRYGWNHKELAGLFTRSHYGRSAVMKENTYSKSDTRRDPDHYEAPFGGNYLMNIFSI